MIKFKIDDKEYKLPDYLSIGDYVKIFKLKDIFSDDYFAAKLVSTISDAKIEDLLEADYQYVNYLGSYLLSLIPKDKSNFVDRFELDGVDYGFFPDWTQITFAEFVDMDTISTKKPNELLNYLHILAAIMYRPIVEENSKHDFKIEKYDIEKMKKRAELFKEKLDVKYILSAQFFFINFANRFLSYTQISSIPKLSIWKKMKLLWMMRKWIILAIFRRPLDGSLSSTELLKTILQSTNISLKNL